MKISDDQKRQMLEEVLLKHCSVQNVAKEYGIDYRYLKRMLSIAREHGIESVFHCNTKGSYPFEFKLEVARFIDTGHAYGEAATKYGLTYSLGRSWFLKYSAGGAEALHEEKRGRKPLRRKENGPEAISEDESELQRLRRHNEELTKKLRYAEMENEFLKKLDALVRERIERENRR